MKFHSIFSILVLSGTLVVSQFVTPSLCNATEDKKTDQKSDPIAQTPESGLLPDALLSLNSETGQFSSFAFLVDKKQRTLTVWQWVENRMKLVGAWPADIGQKEGDKVSQGDHKTPEGIYFFQEMKDGRKVDFSQYGVRIFTLDYPNYYDKLDRKTGGGIWFHAIPETKSLLRGSRGCVVVRNKVIEELSKFIELKRTPMVIVNTVEYLPEKRWLEAQKMAHDWLNSWRTAWTGKDLDKYISWYSDRFKSQGMDKNRWRAYKKALNERYQFIDVALKDIQIFAQGPKLVIRFFQDYKSDQKQDAGTKILYALKDGPVYQIVGETWQPGVGVPGSSPVPAPAPASVPPSQSSGPNASR